MKGSSILMPEDVDTFLRNFAPRCHVCAKTATRMHVPETGWTFWRVEVGLFRTMLAIPSIRTAEELTAAFKRRFDRLIQEGSELTPYINGEIRILKWNPMEGPFLCDDHTTILAQPVRDLKHAHLVRGAEESIERPTRFERILNFDA